MRFTYTRPKKALKLMILALTSLYIYGILAGRISSQVSTTGGFMKQRRLNDEELNGTANTPMQPDFAEAAEAIIRETEDDDQLPAIERAARLAGAYLLLGVAGGSVEGKAAYDFLKGLFEKKTPAPVQRIEQRTHADFRVLFATAIETNPNILQDSLDKAEQAHASIRERLSLPPSLELVADEAEFEEQAVGEPAVEAPLVWKPGQEPAEITSVRKEGENEPVSDRHRRFVEMLQG